MILFLDNAESILDPQGANAREVYAVVEELNRFDNLCLCLTSRISTIPPASETLDIPTLSIDAACDTFFRIYKNTPGGLSDPVDGVLSQLDFHPLSITLLATVAYHSRWDTNRLTREWGGRRTDMLRTRHNDSLAVTIELSLASPTFQELGPDAREVLGVIAFFPQGINEDNLDWLFPTLPDRTIIFDTFSILSLTYRSNGFFTMLAPLRDHLCPKNPASCPLLNAIKDRYFSRLTVAVGPSRPGFEDARWVISEDVNIEHLLDVFTSVDMNSVGVWNACAYFIQHLYWHKRRLVLLGPKMERLPDDHPSKPECLLQLSRLFESVGNHVEYKRLLVYTLKLWRGRGDDFQVAETLRLISDADSFLGFHKEAILQTKEALEIYRKLNNTDGEAQAWQLLARSLFLDNQLDAAEEAASRVIELLTDQGNQCSVCNSYRTLGNICRSKGEADKATGHYETALEIASRFGWYPQLFWIHYDLAVLVLEGKKFDDAHTHVERAKAHAVNDPYLLGRATELDAVLWFRQRRFGEAQPDASGALDLFEKLGATVDVDRCRATLRAIEEAINKQTVSD